MDASQRPGGGTSIHRVLEHAAGDLTDYDDETYIILGVELEGSFEIGVSYGDSGAPPEDIVPLEVYELVNDSIQNGGDIEEMRARTTPEVWPRLGTCHLATLDDGSLSVQIDVADGELIETE